MSSRHRRMRHHTVTLKIAADHDAFLFFQQFVEFQIEAEFATLRIGTLKNAASPEAVRTMSQSSSECFPADAHERREGTD